MNKICNDKCSDKKKYYTRKELDALAKTKLKMKSKDIKKYDKKELCKILGIEYESKKKKTTISDEIVCTDRNCKKKYPKRMKKTELINLAKQKFPHYSKSKLRLSKTAEICKILNIKYVKCPSVQKHAKTMKKQQEILPQSQSSLDCVKRNNLTLNPHQLKIVKYLQNHRGILLYHKVGSGKTITAITVSQCYLDKYPDRHVIVITPASLIANFKTQMLESYKDIKHAKQYKFYSIQGFVNASKKKEIQCDKCLVIVDEAHNLKTSYSKSESKKGPKKVTQKGINSKHVIECAENADKVLLLSATPIINSPHDLVPLYNMIREKDEPRMVVKSKNINPTKEIGYSEEKLIKLMKCKISIYDKQDNKFYPKFTEHDIFLKMTPSYQEKYDTLLDSMGLSKLAIKHFGDINIEKFYNGFRRAVNTLEDENSPKIQWVLEKLKSRQKTIVYSNFIDSGNLVIIKNLPKDIKYAYIKGDLPKSKRAEIVEKYNKNELQVLFISKAGGEGLDLKETRNIILLEPSWNQSTEDQIIGRGIRYKSHYDLPKNEQHVDIYRLYLIKSSDKIHNFKKKKDDIQSEQKIVLDPFTNSIDLLMKKIIDEKELRLENFRIKIQNITIEEFPCE